MENLTLLISLPVARWVSIAQAEMDGSGWKKGGCDLFRLSSCWFFWWGTGACWGTTGRRLEKYRNDSKCSHFDTWKPRSNVNVSFASYVGICLFATKIKASDLLTRKKNGDRSVAAD